MDDIKIERLGGLAGYGSANSRLKSRGGVQFDALSPDDRKSVESLFTQSTEEKASLKRDGFTYRITRQTKDGSHTIEVPEEAVPQALIATVKDEIE